MATKRYKVLIVEEDSVEFGEYIELDLNGENIFFDGGAEFDADNLTTGIIEAKAEATGKARFIKQLTHNGAVADGTFFGVTENIPGDSTPISFPRDCVLEELVFSNNRSTADFTIYLRKGSTTATPFATYSRTNTLTFSEVSINESITAGTSLYVEYQDDGGNSRDVFIDLYIRNA